MCTILIFVYKSDQTKNNFINISLNQTEMEEEHFYLHLSSNVRAVSPLQVGNTIGNFVTHLSRKLNLTDEWEVGVTDVQYSKTWYNIMNDEYVTIIFSEKQQRFVFDDSAPEKDLTFLALSAGNYNSPQDICTKITEAIKYNLSLENLPIAYYPQLEYNKESNKIKMTFGMLENKSFAHIHFSEYLASMLGFLDSQGRQYPIGFEPDHPWWAVKSALYDESHPLFEPLALTINKTIINPANSTVKNQNLPNEFTDQQRAEQQRAERERLNQSQTDPRLNRRPDLQPNPQQSPQQPVVQQVPQQPVVQQVPQQPVVQQVPQQPVVQQVPQQPVVQQVPQQFVVQQVLQQPVVQQVPQQAVVQQVPQQPVVQQVPQQPVVQQVPQQPVVQQVPQQSVVQQPPQTPNPPRTRTRQPKAKPRIPGGRVVEEEEDSKEVRRDHGRKKRSLSDDEIYTRTKRNTTQVYKQTVNPSDNDLYIVKPQYIEGFSQVSLNAGINSLYIYCDIIKPTIIGNTEARIIRRVEVPSDKRFGDTVEIGYISPQYYSLVSEEISHIEIDIKDDTNETIKFTSGRTALTLHFRKKAKNVFESIHQLLR